MHFVSRALYSTLRTPASPHARPQSLRAFTLPRPYLRGKSLPLCQHLPTSRNMSSIPIKKEFLCILPDKPGVMDKRIAVRPSHLINARDLTAAGTIVAGGAMLEAHPGVGESPEFKGSMMMVLGDNEAEVRALLESDVYAREGVWDMEKAQIYPFKSVVREQL